MRSQPKPRTPRTPAADLPDSFDVTLEDGSTWHLERYVNKYMRSEVMFTLTPSVDDGTPPHAPKRGGAGRG